jgi:hypothetical protein
MAEGDLNVASLQAAVISCCAGPCRCHRTNFAVHKYLRPATVMMVELPALKKRWLTSYLDVSIKKGLKGQPDQPHDC